jgi:molybdate transport system ATP-binding protein
MDADLPSGVCDVFVCIRAEEVILTRPPESIASPRNRLAGEVRTLEFEGLLARITVDCGFPLVVVLTRQAAQLALQAGADVVAWIKAPHIHLVART